MPIDKIPKKLRPAAYAIRQWAITESPVMLVVGMSSLLTGLAYVTRPPNPPYHIIEGSPFILAFGIVWVVVGGLLVLSSCIKSKGSASSIVLGFSVMLHVLWSGSLFTQYLFIDFGAGAIMRAFQYAALAALTVYSVWIKSVIVETVVVPTEEEVEDVLRGDTP